MHPVLRPFQRDALRALEEPGHVLCIAPTGSGKSLIYEKLSEARLYRTVLFSPLVALARQQFQRLARLGVPVTLGSGAEAHGPPDSRTGVWIISPETLLNPRKKSLLENWHPDFLVMDECHCLFDWGEGFRPAFRAIPGLIQEFRIPRSLWLTATLTRPRETSLRELLPKPFHRIGHFETPSGLHWKIRRSDWICRPQELLDELARLSGPGVLFAPTRELCSRLSRLTALSGRSALAYHAGLSDEERRNTEARIRNRSKDIIVATSAFGMGMDYSHLRWMILWQAPPSLTFMTQAAGRVARGGDERADAVVFWSPEDHRFYDWMIRNDATRTTELMDTFDFLRMEQCRNFLLQSYYGAHFPAEECARCDFCERRRNTRETSM